MKQICVLPGILHEDHLRHIPCEENVHYKLYPGVDSKFPFRGTEVLIRRLFFSPSVALPLPQIPRQ
ncbi:hypothetical protein Taro_045611, partial [Colocasia esculenta]|nr:hypothetical protein [Colocasia esculenta]